MRKISQNQKEKIMMKYNNLSNLQRQILCNISLDLKEKSKKCELQGFSQFSLEIKNAELKELQLLKEKLLIFEINDRELFSSWINDLILPIKKKKKMTIGYSLTTEVRDILHDAVFDMDQKMIDLNYK